MLSKYSPIIVEGDIKTVLDGQPVPPETGASTMTKLGISVTRTIKGAGGPDLDVFGTVSSIVSGESPAAHGVFFLSNPGGRLYVMAGGQGLFWPTDASLSEWKNNNVYGNGVTQAVLEEEIVAGMRMRADEDCPPVQRGDYVGTDAGVDAG